jgi:hypothetical protein
MPATLTAYSAPTPAGYAEESRSLDPQREKYEWAWVALILFAFLTVNVLTADRYPFPFFDEVLYTDPAINYVMGHGFTSAVLAVNSPVFYFYNGPAHSALLIPWLKVVGVSMRAVRSINFVYMAATLLLIWSAAKRIGLIASARWRLLLVLMLICDYSIVFSYRCGRYDCLGMLEVAFAFWSFSLKSGPLRLTALTIAGAASPWIGLQLLPLQAVLGGTLLVFTLFRYWREMLAFSVGIAAGGLGLIRFFSSHGVLDYFIQFLHSQSKGPGFVSGLVQGEFRHSNMLPKDFSLPFVIGAALLLAAALYGRRSLRLRSPLMYGLVVVFSLAVTLILVGKFPTYYGWMTFVPLAICTCATLDLELPAQARHVAVGLCVLAILVGVGMHVLACAGDWKDRDYSKVQQFVASSIRPDDWVYVTSPAYYAAKLTGAPTFFWDPGTRMSAAQRSRVTVCVIDPSRTYLLKQLGGEWYSTGQEMTPAHTGLFGSNDRWGILSLPNYRLSVYRRVPTT